MCDHVEDAELFAEAEEGTVMWLFTVEQALELCVTFKESESAQRGRYARPQRNERMFNWLRSVKPVSETVRAAS